MNKKKSKSIFMIKVFLLGFVMSLYFQNINSIRIPAIFDFRNTVITSVITMIIIGMLGVLILLQYKKAKQYKEKMAADEGQADKYDKLFNSVLMNCTWIQYSISILPVIHMAIVVVFKADERGWLVAAVPIVLSSLLAISSSNILPKLDERFPKASDPDFTDKLINKMDEGEKHISYSVLFKLFRYNLFALMIIILISILTAAFTNQDYALIILLLLGLYIFNIVFYYSKIQKYYKTI